MRLPVSMAAVLTTCLLSACGSASEACTLIGGTNSLTLDLSPGTRERLALISVYLCQEERCEEGHFSMSMPDSYDDQGEFLPDGSYRIDLDRVLGGDWRPEAKANVKVEGVTPRNVVVQQKNESFRWKLSYPNGKKCDKSPFLSHTVQVG